MKKIVPFLALLFCTIWILTGAPDEKVKTTPRGALENAADGPWTDSVNVSKTGQFCNYPAVAADDQGNVHVIWVQYLQGRGQVYYNKGDYLGQWGTPTNLTQGEVRIGEGPWAEIQVDVNGNPNVVYSAVPADNYDVLMKRFRDNRWGPHENVSRTSIGGSAYPNLVIDRTNNDYYVFWQDDENAESPEQTYWEIMCRYLNGGEGQWVGAGVLPDGSHRTYAPQADIDEKSKIYLVYANRAMGDLTRVFFTESPNAKDWTKWEPVRDISGLTGVSFAYPQIAVDWAGNCYVVWMDTREGNVEVFFRKRVNRTWSDIENLSNSPAASEDPFVACNKETGEIYVTWEEGNKIKLRQYANGKWGEILNMTDTNSQSLRPHVYVTMSGTVHLVYADNRTGQWNVYHRSKMGRPPDPPQPPVDLRVTTKLDDSVTPNTKTNLLKWKENPENANIPRENYNLYRKEQGQTDNQYELIGTFPITVFSHEDTGLATAVKFVYAVSVTDTFEQESELSAPESENPIFPPLRLALETKINRILFRSEKINYLFWAHNPLNDPVATLSYNIYRKLSPEDDSQFALITTADANTFFYMDRGLSFSEKYTYAITVSDTEGHETPRSRAVIGEEDD